jgi:hypothetical protein
VEPAEDGGQRVGSGRPTGTSSRLPDRAWVPAVGALTLALAFMAALLVRAGGDVSLLVHAAPPWTSTEAAPDSLTVQGVDDGFDGQFFYRLGVAPWSTDEAVAGVTFDLPALRNARWGYGALAWVASGGVTDLVPWSLVVVNLAAATAVGALGGRLARSAGRHAAWGLLFVLWPGFAYSLSMDTSELVASAFLLGGLLALRHDRHLRAGLLLTAAVITRDTTAAVPTAVALAGAWLWLRQGRTDEHLRLTATGAAPLATFGAWQLLQRARFGELPLTSSGDNNLNAPLAGLFEQLGGLIVPSGADEAFRLLNIVGLIGLLALAGWALRLGASSSSRPWEATGWVLALGVVALLNAYLWSGATAFMRAATEAGVLSTVIVVSASGRGASRLRTLAAVVLGGLWLITAVAQLTKLG